MCAVPDIYLYPDTPYGPNDIVIGVPSYIRPPSAVVGGRYEGDLRKRKRPLLPTDLGYEIVAETLYGHLVEDYGKVEGERIYLLMEREGKGPFKPDGKYARFRKRT